MILTKHLTFVLKLELNRWVSGKWRRVRVGGSGGKSCWGWWRGNRSHWQNRTNVFQELPNHSLA